MNDPSSQPVQYPTLLTILKYKKWITAAGAVICFLLICWFGFRADMPDLYSLAVLTGLFIYFLLKAVIEVIDLIADTLMPR